jgi:uncharacterized protein (TIGR01244 family)
VGQEGKDTMVVHRMSDRISVSGALTSDDVRRLATDGFHGIVDLRSDGEPRPQGMSPWDEAQLAKEVGLTYRQVTVEPQMLGDSLARAVLQAIRSLPSPILVHCTTGRRASTFALLQLASEQDLSVDDCLARGRAMGLDFEGMPRLTKFLREFVEGHGRHYRPADEAPDRSNIRF